MMKVDYGLFLASGTLFPMRYKKLWNVRTVKKNAKTNKVKRKMFENNY